jgi:hypothetical protein
MKKKFQHCSASSSSAIRRVELSNRKGEENLSYVQSQGEKQLSAPTVSAPISSLPSASKEGKVAVSQGIVEDESEVIIQLIECEPP